MLPILLSPLSLPKDFKDPAAEIAKLFRLLFHLITLITKSQGQQHSLAIPKKVK